MSYQTKQRPKYWPKHPWETERYRWPVRQHAWVRLYQFAPALRDVLNTGPNEKSAPRPLTKFQLLSFAAAFADPEQREILRALVLDLLTDDIVELLKPCEEADF